MFQGELKGNKSPFGKCTVTAQSAGETSFNTSHRVLHLVQPGWCEQGGDTEMNTVLQHTLCKQRSCRCVTAYQHSWGHICNRKSKVSLQSKRLKTCPRT